MQTSLPVKSARASSFYVDQLKPLLDILFAFIALILLLPAFLLVYVLLIWTNGNKMFFVQERIGYMEKPFLAIKFRTMNEARNEKGELLPDAQRLTGIGKWIRKTSLDELPQIINVLRGDMSFVGPRPLLPEYLPYYDQLQKKRHSVKPGITGLAQVNGRNLTTWEKRFDLDIQYTEMVSLGLDMSILLRTLVKVMKSEGISAEGHATMPKFSDYIKEKRR